MHLTKIILENFQSHEKTEIKFAPTLNVIIGANNTGKTSILRALRLVIYNEPDSRSFIRQGASFCRIVTEWSNGYTIIREKGRGTLASRNLYIVIDPQGEEEVFSSFGKNVPQRITELLGFGVVEIGGETHELNYGKPLESPFLLTLSSAKKATFMGQLVEDFRIDKVLTNVASESRKSKMTIGTLSSQIAEKKDVLSHDDTKKLRTRLKQVRKELEEVEEQQVLRNKLVSNSKSLQSIVSGLKVCQERIEELSVIDSINIEPLLEQRQLYAHLYRLQKIYKEVTESIDDVQVLVGRKLPSVGDLPEKIDIYHRLQSVYTSLSEIDSQIKTQRQALKNTDESLTNSKDELKSLLEKIAVCPFCSRPLEGEDVARIISHRHTSTDATFTIED